MRLGAVPSVGSSGAYSINNDLKESLLGNENGDKHLKSYGADDNFL